MPFTEILGVFAQFQDAALLMAVLIIGILTAMVWRLGTALGNLTEKSITALLAQAESNARLNMAVEQQTRILERR